LAHEIGTIDHRLDPRLIDRCDQLFKRPAVPHGNALNNRRLDDHWRCGRNNLVPAQQADKRNAATRRNGFKRPRDMGATDKFQNVVSTVIPGQRKQSLDPILPAAPYPGKPRALAAQPAPAAQHSARDRCAGRAIAIDGLTRPGAGSMPR
jgi:hypothetical protein